MTGFLVLMAGAAVAAKQYLENPRHLPLRVIKIQGELEHVDRHRLEQVVAGAINGGFFTIDMNTIRERVQSIPWVDQAHLSRHWPETLVLHVTERRAVARWGKRALVTARGVVFLPELDLSPSPGIQFNGPEGSAARVTSFYRKVFEGFADQDLTIEQLQLDDRLAWSIRLRNGLELALGDEQPEVRINRFLRTYPSLLSQYKEKKIGSIDLRYQHGFSVKWIDDAVPKHGIEQQSKA